MSGDASESFLGDVRWKDLSALDEMTVHHPRACAMPGHDVVTTFQQSPSILTAVRLLSCSSIISK